MLKVYGTSSVLLSSLEQNFACMLKRTKGCVNKLMIQHVYNDYVYV